MNAEELGKTGLSLNEAKVYLALLRLGRAQAGKVSKESQINRTTTYDCLEGLIEKGLAAFAIEAGRKVFRPAAPERLLAKAKEQEEAISSILPELKLLFKASKEEEESDVFRGRKGMKSILQDILSCKEYVAFGSSGRFLEVMKHDFEQFQKRKKELGVKARVILSQSAKGTGQVRLSHTKFKYMPREYATPTTTFVYKDKTAIIIWSQTPIATVITSKDVAYSYKKYFEMLWKTAKI